MLALFLPALASAQENYEIQVYSSPTQPKGRTMFELHSNYTIKGDSTASFGMVPSHHSIHETVEITHGLNDWSELGFYLFTNQSPSNGFQFAGTHIRPRVAVPEAWKWPVGLSLSQEFGWAPAKYSADEWTYELRPIIDKEMGRYYVSLNPVLGKSLRGPNSAEPFEFTPNVLAAVDVSKKVNLGLEYYGALGTINRFAPASEQAHQLFYVLNYDFGPDYEFNIGYGVGLNGNSEKSMIKLILGRLR
jgi:hypothetical protein